MSDVENVIRELCELTDAIRSGRYLVREFYVENEIDIQNATGGTNPVYVYSGDRHIRLLLKRAGRQGES